MLPHDSILVKSTMAALLDQVRESFEGPIVSVGSSGQQRRTRAHPGCCMAVRACLCHVQDFVGQKHAEQYAQNILIPSASIGFVVGWLAQDIRITLGIFGFGVLLALAVSDLSRQVSQAPRKLELTDIVTSHWITQVAVPPWSFYNENPVAWLPVVPSAEAPETKKTI